MYVCICIQKQWSTAFSETFVRVRVLFRLIFQQHQNETKSVCSRVKSFSNHISFHKTWCQKNWKDISYQTDNLLFSYKIWTIDACSSVPVLSLVWCVFIEDNIIASVILLYIVKPRHSIYCKFHSDIELMKTKLYSDKWPGKFTLKI